MAQTTQNDTADTLPLILAGGVGSRLYPLTAETPKPLLPLDGTPPLRRLLGLLSDAGYTRAVITVCYHADKIRAEIGNRFEALSVSYYEEGDQPRGTAGSILAAWETFALTTDRHALVLSGDAVLSCDLSGFLHYYIEKNADACILTARVSDPSAFGTVLSDGEGRITRFSEKPSARHILTDAVNTGLYLFRRSFLETLPHTVPLDFGNDVFGQPRYRNARFYAYDGCAYWCDVGSFAAFRVCALDAANGRLPDNRFPRKKRADGCSVGDGCIVSGTAVLTDSVLFDRVTVGDGAHCTSVILGNGVVIGENAVLGAGCVLGDNCRVDADAVLPAGTVVGGGCVMQVRQSAGAETAGGQISPDEELHRRRFDDGYYLGRIQNGQAHTPDPHFCAVLGNAVAKTAEKTGRALFFAVCKSTRPTDTDDTAPFPELLSVLAKGKNGTVCEGVLDLSCACIPEETPFLRVLLTAYDGIPAVLFRDEGGHYPPRSVERALDTCLCAALSADDTDGDTGFRQERVQAHTVTERYLARFAHSHIRTLRRVPHFSADSALLISLLASMGAKYNEASPLRFTCDTVGGQCSVTDGITFLSRFDMMTVCLPVVGKFCVLPADAPEYCVSYARRRGIEVRLRGHCPTDGERLPPFPVFDDPVLLCAAVCRRLWYEHTTLRTLSVQAGLPFSPVVRAERIYGIGAPSAAMRRLLSENGYCPTEEGALLHMESGECVRIMQNRAGNLRILADSFSAEMAETLCDSASAVLRNME